MLILSSIFWIDNFLINKCYLYLILLSLACSMHCQYNTKNKLGTIPATETDFEVSNFNSN